MSRGNLIFLLQFYPVFVPDETFKNPSSELPAQPYMSVLFNLSHIRRIYLTACNIILRFTLRKKALYIQNDAAVLNINILGFRDSSACTNMKKSQTTYLTEPMFSELGVNADENRNLLILKQNSVNI